MSNNDVGAGYIAGMTVTTFLFVMIGSTAMCTADQERKRDRSAEACKPARALSAGNGIATCSDGRVWRWREGYTVPVGRTR